MLVVGSPSFQCNLWEVRRCSVCKIWDHRPLPQHPQVYPDSQAWVGSHQLIHPQVQSRTIEAWAAVIRDETQANYMALAALRDAPMAHMQGGGVKPDPRYVVKIEDAE